MVLIHGDGRVWIFGWCREAPAVLSTRSFPLSTCFAGNDYLNTFPFCGFKLCIMMWKRPHKSFQHGVVKFPRLNSGLMNDLPDLLLMMPFLGVFPCDVKPVF